MLNANKGKSIKDVRSHGVCPVRTRGSSDADVCALFVTKKLTEFSKFISCPHGQGGSIFRDFVRTTFMDTPLSSTEVYSVFVTSS